MRPSRPDLIGSLLTRPERTSTLTPQKPQQTSAISRRLQAGRQKPVEMLTNVLKEREAAASSASMEIPGGEAHGHGEGLEFSGDVSEAEFNRRLQKMMSEAPGGISITSGKRDPQKQKDLWAKALKKYGDPEIADNWVARPGTSKHEHGLAADLKFANDAVKKWFNENAKKYGLYFPMGNEPWHIQYDTSYKPAQPQTRSAPTGRAVGGGVVQRGAGRFYTGNPHVDFIIDGESGGRVDAKNPKSSAFGIGQMIIANRKAYGQRLGFDPNTTNPQQQIAMMMEYIKDRYGTPEAAAAFKRKHGWY